jgi:hypothetical protein
LDGSTCPDTPAPLFDRAGRPLPARALVYFGLTRGAALPTELRQRLHQACVPYRVIPVALPDHVALYGPTDVVTGTAAILDRLFALGG